MQGRGWAVVVALAIVLGVTSPASSLESPTLGDVTVIDLAGQGADGKLLAATLQGIANRSEARAYLLGSRAAADDQYWLDWYQSEGLITVDATVDLATALATFAPDVAGYVLADPSEPWTINTATTAAGAIGGVVATPATLAMVQGAGLTEIDDHRGRWPDAVTAYEAIADQYRAEVTGNGVAIQQTYWHYPRDLYVQQGMLVMYTRPSQPDFDRVYDVLETFPRDEAVYGYVADDGDEEVEAVARLALDGRYLVPTDSTDNLSFHQAVGGDTRAQPTPSDAEVEPCSPDDTNVVLALSDGDNMVIPEAYMPRANAWSSPRRGELPIGWGIGAVTSVLMPAVWDHYVSTASPNDEIVDIMGLGYTFPSVMPGGTDFLTRGNQLRADLGIGVHWSLDALIREPDAGGWNAWQDAIDATSASPTGILLNYIDFGGSPWFHTPGGVPVLASQEAEYGAAPDAVRDQIQALVDADPADRPLVNLFAVTVWATSYGDLVDAVLPLEDQGVRFLTPSEAFACLPDPPAQPVTTTPTSTPVSTPAAPAPAALPATAVPGSVSYTG